MNSIWSKNITFEEQENLCTDLSTEVVIIGAGMAGILTAYLLRQKNVEAVVLEAGRIAGGQTKNTTAKITSQHNLIYDKLIKNFGEEKARQYADANEQAIKMYKRIIEQEKIDCDFKMLPSYLYSTIEEEALIKETEAAKKVGISAEFTKEIDLPFKVMGASRFERQAQFHPLKFLKELVKELEIYERTKVKKVEGNMVITENGTIKAGKIIFASHYPFINVPGYYFMRMHQERSYIIALENVETINGMYLGIDEGGHSFRMSGPFMLLGGEKHRTGENRAGGQYGNLRKKAEELWRGSKEVAFWSAQDCMTLDGVPYIGRYSSATPDWYVETGFGKWGMTGSMVSAMIISDLVTGKKAENAEVFSPQRFTISASAKTFFEEGIQSVKHLSKKLIAPPRAYVRELPLGHGGVVEVKGEKAGVYKNEKGEVFVVSVTCPHLGCQLEWNPEEKSWDCPCHGSRFDYEGNLLDNPSGKGIANE